MCTLRWLSFCDFNSSVNNHISYKCFYTETGFCNIYCCALLHNVNTRVDYCNCLPPAHQRWQQISSNVSWTLLHESSPTHRSLTTACCMSNIKIFIGWMSPTASNINCTSTSTWHGTTRLVWSPYTSHGSSGMTTSSLLIICVVHTPRSKVQTDNRQRTSIHLRYIIHMELSTRLTHYNALSLSLFQKQLKTLASFLLLTLEVDDDSALYTFPLYHYYYNCIVKTVTLTGVGCTAVTTAATAATFAIATTMTILFTHKANIFKCCSLDWLTGCTLIKKTWNCYLIPFYWKQHISTH